MRSLEVVVQVFDVIIEGFFIVDYVNTLDLRVLTTFLGHHFSLDLGRVLSFCFNFVVAFILFDDMRAIDGVVFEMALLSQLLHHWPTRHSWLGHQNRVVHFRSWFRLPQCKFGSFC